MRRFLDRYSAGRALGRILEPELGGDSLVQVLALPNGGVPVGIAVAARLSSSLDVIVARKLTVPGFEELAFGAAAPGGVLVLDADTIRQFQLSSDVVSVLEIQESREIRRKDRIFRAGLPPIDLTGKITVIVDDGAATGLTMTAALQWAKTRGASRIVAALPVAGTAARRRLSEFPGCELCVCKPVPESIHAVGSWYEEFPRLSDPMVAGMLQRSRLDCARFAGTSFGNPGGIGEFRA